jgi:1-deoxy-D-xylulose-5-phosphate synthase
VYTDIYSLRFIKPFDENYFLSLAKNYDEVAVIEDGVKTGGVGEYIENLLFEHGFKNIKVFAFPERFFAQGTRAEVLSDAGLSSRKIVERICNR